MEFYDCPKKLSLMRKIQDFGPLKTGQKLKLNPILKLIMFSANIKVVKNDIHGGVRKRRGT